MAPRLFEESLPAAPQTARTWGPKPNLAAKFALFVATGGLLMRPDRRRHHDLLDLAFQVHLFAVLITLVLGLLLMYVSMAAPPDSTTTGNGKLMIWVTLFMSVVTLVLSSYFLIFAN